MLSWVGCKEGCCGFGGVKGELVQLCICCRYSCTCVSAVLMMVWVDSIVMSSAYVIVLTFGGGVGRSDM